MAIKRGRMLTWLSQGEERRGGCETYCERKYVM